MGVLTILVAVLAGMTAQDQQAVELPVKYDAPYVLRTEITRSVRKDAEPAVVDTQAWEVRVTPTDQGFHTVWRDREKRQSTAMEIETDETLSPVRITNLDAIRREMGAALRSDDKDGTGERVLEFFGSLPEATLTALLTQDATLVSLGQGRRLAPGELYRYTESSQPFSNGPVVDMQASFELREVDEAAGRAVVLWTSSLDEKGSRDLWPGLVRALAGPMGLDPNDQTKMEEMMKDGSFSQTRRCRYEIQIDTGLASTISCVFVQEVSLLNERSKKETRFDATQTLVP